MHKTWIGAGEQVELKTFSLEKETRGTCIIPKFERDKVKAKEGQEKGVESNSDNVNEILEVGVERNKFKEMEDLEKGEEINKVKEMREVEQNKVEDKEILKEGVERNKFIEMEDPKKGEEMNKVKEMKEVEDNEVLEKGEERDNPRKKAKRVKKLLELLAAGGRSMQLRYISDTRRHLYDGLNNVDIVSKEESEQRIEICGVVTGILLLIPATILTVLLGIEVFWKLQSPMVITPKLPNHSETFPKQHIALIYHDGSVFDISLNENLSPSKQLLMKLPNDKTYFGFANEQQGILNFISSTICRPITQFKFKHSIIPNSKPKMVDPMHYHFTQGIQVGNMFWVWGVDNAYRSEQVLSNPKLKTFLYYWKRNTWKKGPSFFTPEIRGPWATTAINATTAMTVFDVYSDDDNLHDPMIAYVYDFELERWIKYPKLKPILQEHQKQFPLFQFSLTTLISKTARKVYLHASLFCFLELESSATIWILSYDLKDGPNGVWMVEHKGPKCMPKTSEGSIFHIEILCVNISLLS